MPKKKSKNLKYSEQDIIKGVQEAWEKGIDLRVTSIQKGPYRWVYRYHKNYFKNWNLTLKKAGISYEEIQAKAKEPKKKLFLEELAKAYEKGVELTSIVLQKKGNPNRGLYDRATTYFKGRFFWENALEAAELPVDEIVKQRRWDKEKVKNFFIRRNKEGKLLNSAAVIKDECNLYKAAITHFDSYDDALTYAGFKPKKIRKNTHLSELEIILKIIELKTKNKNLNKSKILKSKNKSLKRCIYSAEKKFKGGWEEAVRTAGIDYGPYKILKRNYWSEKKIIEKIKKAFENGISLNGSYVNKNLRDLYSAATRYIGSWKKAVEKAGLNYDDLRIQRKSLSKSELIEEIIQLNEQGIDLSSSNMPKNKDPLIRSIYVQAINRFKSWSQAISTAGINYDEIRRVHKPHTIEDLIIKVQLLESEGINLNPSSIQSNKDYSWLYSVVIKRMDSWADFLESAEIDSKKYCNNFSWKSGKRVIEHLKEKYDSGIVTGSSNDVNFAAAAQRYFKTIKGAVEAADMVYTKSGKITKKMLADPVTVGRIYKHNQEYLEGIAKRVFFGAKRYGLRTLDITDFTNEAFTKLLEILPEKPSKIGLRKFAYHKIYRSLIDLNKKMFKEITFGEEVYLDLFKEG